MSKKIDGVIEAVRYKNGQIVMVRAYEKRDATFSDRTLLDRKTLLEKMQNKKRFVVGSRKALLASTFDTGKALQIIELDGRVLIVTNMDASNDNLEGAPVF